MNNDYKFTYANINKTAFNQELEKRGSYFANVVMWTTLFTLPLFVLLDYLFCKEFWTEFLLIRIIGAGLCYLIYTYGKSQKWSFSKIAMWFLSVFVITNSIITALVPNEVGNPLAYFLILAITILLISSTLAWSPTNTIILCLISFATIIAVYVLKQDVNKYSNLVEQGGGVYFLMAAFSCFLAYTRYQVTCRDAEKTVMMDEANSKLVSKNVEIKEQQYKVAENNRILKSVSENSLDNMTVIVDDVKSFSENVKSNIDALKTNAYNLMPSQLEALNKITADNEKLSQMTEKLTGTAAAVSTAAAATSTTVNTNTPIPEVTITHNRETFDINPEVEKSVLDVAENAMLKNMSLQLNISPAANNVHQDKLFTDQVLSKLMNNVIRLSEPGSIITVRAENQNNKAIIETVSHGAVIGMDRLEEMMNRLKYSSITDENSLNDLGLIATKKLVESMNGSFNYNSEHNTGNYFKIEFPSAQ